MLSVLLAVLLLAAALIFIIWGGQIGSAGIGSFGKKAGTDVFYYDAGGNAAYADIDGGLAVASSSGLQVFDRDGNQTLSEIFVMNSPSVDQAGGHVAAYDLGGTQLRFFDRTGMILSLTAEDTIISADVSSSGRLAVCTESSGYRGQVTVYSASGEALFKWYSGEGYVLSAALSDDGKELAVLTLTENGSRIVKLRTNDDEYLKAEEFEGELIIDVAYTPKGNLAALTASSLYFIYDSDSIVRYDFEGKYLNDYSFDGGMIALSLLDYKSGVIGELVLLEENGTEKASVPVSGILSLSCAEKHAAVLTGSGLTIYDSNLEITAEYDGLSGYSDVIMRADNTAAAATGHHADVFGISG